MRVSKTATFTIVLAFGGATGCATQAAQSPASVESPFFSDEPPDFCSGEWRRLLENELASIPPQMGEDEDGLIPRYEDLISADVFDEIIGIIFTFDFPLTLREWMGFDDVTVGTITANLSDIANRRDVVTIGLFSFSPTLRGLIFELQRTDQGNWRLGELYFHGNVDRPVKRHRMAEWNRCGWAGQEPLYEATLEIACPDSGLRGRVHQAVVDSIEPWPVKTVEGWGFGKPNIPQLLETYLHNALTDDAQYPSDFQDGDSFPGAQPDPLLVRMLGDNIRWSVIRGPRAEDRWALFWGITVLIVGDGYDTDSGPDRFLQLSYLHQGDGSLKQYKELSSSVVAYGYDYHQVIDKSISESVNHGFSTPMNCHPLDVGGGQDVAMLD